MYTNTHLYTPLVPPTRRTAGALCDQTEPKGEGIGLARVSCNGVTVLWASGDEGDGCSRESAFSYSYI